MEKEKISDHEKIDQQINRYVYLTDQDKYFSSTNQDKNVKSEVLIYKEAVEWFKGGETTVLNYYGDFESLVKEFAIGKDLLKQSKETTIKINPSDEILMIKLGLKSYSLKLIKALKEFEIPLL